MRRRFLGSLTLAVLVIGATCAANAASATSDEGTDTYGAGTGDLTNSGAVEISSEHISVEIQGGRDTSISIPLTEGDSAPSVGGPRTAPESTPCSLSEQARDFIEAYFQVITPGGDRDEVYNLVVCKAFGANSTKYWPAGDPVPADVLEVMARSALGSALVTPPTIEASPNGTSIPFLVQLPTLFWVDPAAWAPTSASASIPEIGVTLTATLTPDHMIWDPGDGGNPITCRNNVPYDGTETPTGCSHIYTSTNGGDPVTVTARTIYTATVSCVPAERCPNLVQPGPVTATHSLEATIIQVRPVLTR